MMSVDQTSLIMKPGSGRYLSIQRRAMVGEP